MRGRVLLFFDSLLELGWRQPIQRSMGSLFVVFVKPGLRRFPCLTLHEKVDSMEEAKISLGVHTMSKKKK